ncbi:unnamed protein product [Acanthoscelides obtectus]|nr:unnamed protein product [Acanthoscelides obtectus]CAK1658143.1 hypothetical protein AOBTE_LOCUS20722 [Acanthoscelides obtectus]
MEDVAGVLLEQNPAFVKTIKVAPCNGTKPNKPVPSQSSSSGGGTLTTIPEGKVDSPIPKPIWPMRDKRLLVTNYDSLVDDALLLYTSMTYTPEKIKSLETYIDMSVKDLLLELLHGINETLEGKNDTPPEDMLKIINDRIRTKLEGIKASTDEEMKRLCVNLSNCTRKNSVLRALSNSSSSGNSSKSTDWSGRVRTSSSETEDIYQVPSGSSSSGFSSESAKELSPAGIPRTVFVHDDLSAMGGAMSQGARNTLMGANGAAVAAQQPSAAPKKSLLRAVDDEKPSVWEQYYGVRATAAGGHIRNGGVVKPTDVPLFVSTFLDYYVKFLVGRVRERDRQSYTNMADKSILFGFHNLIFDISYMCLIMTCIQVEGAYKFTHFLQDNEQC